MTAPSPRTIAMVTSIVRSVVARMESEGTIDTDEAAAMEALREEVPDVDMVLSRLLRAMGEAEANRDAVGGRIKALQARSARFDRQYDNYRAAVMSILDACQLTKWQSPEYTVSVREGKPAVVISDVEALPAGYTITETKPDRAVIKAAMEQGVVIPGVEWGNGGVIMTVRDK
jgi:hypothetical protein